MRAALTALVFTLLCASAQAKLGDVWLADPDSENCTTDTGYVYDVNPSTHVVGILASGGYLRSPRDVAASPDGKTVWVADADAFYPPGGCNSGPGGVIAIDTTTGAQTIVSNFSNPATTWAEPISIAYDGVHNRLVVLDRPTVCCTDKIYGVDLTTHAQTLLVDSASLATPQSIVVSASGAIYVVDDTVNGGSAPQISRVDESTAPTGPYSLVAVSTDPDLGLPRDIAFAANGDLLVFDESVSGTHP